jgi:hypothetical protein
MFNLNDVLSTKMVTKFNEYICDTLNSNNYETYLNISHQVNIKLLKFIKNNTTSVNLIIDLNDNIVTTKDSHSDLIKELNNLTSFDLLKYRNNSLNIYTIKGDLNTPSHYFVNKLSTNFQLNLVSIVESIDNNARSRLESKHFLDCLFGQMRPVRIVILLRVQRQFSDNYVKRIENEILSKYSSDYKRIDTSDQYFNEGDFYLIVFQFKATTNKDTINNQLFHLDSNELETENFQLINKMSFPFKNTNFYSNKERNYLILKQVKFLNRHLSNRNTPFNNHYYTDDDKKNKRDSHEPTQYTIEKELFENKLSSFGGVRLGCIKYLFTHESMKQFSLKLEQFIHILKVNNYKFTKSGQFIIYQNEQDDNEWCYNHQYYDKDQYNKSKQDHEEFDLNNLQFENAQTETENANDSISIIDTNTLKLIENPYSSTNIRLYYQYRKKRRYNQRFLSQLVLEEAILNGQFKDYDYEMNNFS